MTTYCCNVFSIELWPLTVALCLVCRCAICCCAVLSMELCHLVLYCVQSGVVHYYFGTEWPAVFSIQMFYVLWQHVVRCLWHPRLNQIVIGTGNGVCKLFYDPDKSHRGAKLCVVKTTRKKNDVQFVTNQRIITRNYLYITCLYSADLLPLSDTEIVSL